jgi:hypothetical protein
MTTEQLPPPRGWFTSLLIALMAAVVLGLPTGLTLLVLLDSRNATLWFGVFPLLMGALVLAALRHWRPLARDARSARRRRSLIVAAAIVPLIALNALVLVGGVKPRSKCTWEESPEIAANTDLAPGLSLRDDGKGTYSDAVDHVDTFIKHRLALRMSDQLLPPKTTARRLFVDLSHPVPGSGSAPLGVFSTGSRLGTFWYQDPNGMVRSVHAIPLDTTVVSDRTDVMLTIGGKDYQLTMGRWSGTYCEAVAGVGGAGTSAAKINRSGQEDFTVDAPVASIARLWDISGRRPVDKGLYYFGFHAHFKGK